MKDSHISTGNIPLNEYFQPQSIKNHFIKSALGSFLIKIGTIFLSFISAIILARILGVQGFGVYSFCFSIVQLLTVPAMLGLQIYAVREVSNYRSHGQWEYMKGFLYRGTQGILMASIFLGIISLIIAYYLANYVDALSLSAFSVALLLLPLTSLTQFQEAILRGLNYIILGQISRVICPGISIILVGGCFFFLSEMLTPSIVLGIRAMAMSFSLILLYILLRKKISSRIAKIRTSFETKKWVLSAWPMLLASSMWIVNSEVSLVMLGALSKAENVGLYRVAQRGSEIVFFGLLAVNITIAPTISTLYYNKKMDLLQQIITKCSRFILVYAFPTALSLILTSQWLVPLVFGLDFSSAALPLSILCSGQLFNAFIGPVSIVLNMTENEKLTAKGVTISTLINIILNILLIPIWGVTGAALATSISLVIWNILLSVWLFQRLGLTTLPFRMQFLNT